VVAHDRAGVNRLLHGAAQRPAAQGRKSTFAMKARSHGAEVHMRP